VQTTTRARLARRRGDYGLDAPYVPFTFAAIGAVLLAIGLLCIFVVKFALGAVICLAYGLFLLLSTASYVYTSRAGKFQVWSELLTELDLRGDEVVLDLGCGRGAVLLMAAALLPAGKAVGVDLWKTGDQSGNAMEATHRNAEREGVAARVELHTADMRALPVADASVDLVLSSLAIHNIPDWGGRAQAIAEAVRVLKPGCRLLITDIRATRQYAEHLQVLGMSAVQHRSLGWRFWYGGPWVATAQPRLVG